MLHFIHGSQVVIDLYGDATCKMKYKKGRRSAHTCYNEERYETVYCPI